MSRRTRTKVALASGVASAMLGVLGFALGSTACGGIAHRDRERAGDAGASGDAEATFDTARFSPCVARRRLDDDAGALGCRTHADCTGSETCQSGVCCAGQLVGGVCRCGSGDGCAPDRICCQPAGATTASCVSQLAQCAPR